MPLYEYRCVACDDVFERRRSMSEADAELTCPAGHADVKRLLSVFAAGRSGAAAPAPASTPTPAFRGCGGGCACH